MADHRESLARSSAKDNVHALTAYTGTPPDLGSGQSGYRPRQHDAVGKVVCVDTAMDGVDFDSGHNVEAGLLESQP
jgi:hypothetical protein